MTGNCGLLSTIHTWDGKEDKPSSLTTPEALGLFRHFQNAVNSNMQHLVMEVSSQDGKLTAIVDFAHNRLSFEKLYDSVLREYPEHRIYTVCWQEKHCETMMLDKNGC